MDRDSRDPYTLADGHVEEFRRCVKAQKRKLKWLSDTDFIIWDKAVLACPLPGSFLDDKDFAVLDVAIRNDRQRRRDKPNGIFGWRRFLTPADREIWLEYYEKAVKLDSKRPQKDFPVGRQEPSGAL